ncbi:MAG TPA: transposase [Chthoniobacterales bacterium]|nr:transposase [Chthoniobacterales bacterium]
MENNKSRHGRRYDWEFKQSAIALVQEGRTITEVGRDLGVSTCSVSRWVQAATQRAATRPQGRAPADELRHLRQENEYLRRQRDILKKALGILSAGMPGDVSR